MIRIKLKDNNSNENVRIKFETKNTNSFEVLCLISFLVNQLHENDKDLTDDEIKKLVKKISKQYEMEDNKNNE